MPNTVTQGNVNFPLLNYPNSNLSDARCRTLGELNAHISAGRCPSDGVFSEFLRNFVYLGPLDATKNALCCGIKARLLSCAGLCHIGSSGPGRDYLERDGKLEFAGRDALILLNELPLDIRQTMLDNARLGDRYQIILEFPDIELNIPMGSECFGDGQGALTMAEARALLLGRDMREVSLLVQFAQKMTQTDVACFDNHILHAWLSAIDRCVDGKAAGSFSNEREDLIALGVALRTFANKLAGGSPRDDVLLKRILYQRRGAFAKAGHPGECGLAHNDIAMLLLHSGDRDLAKREFTSAGHEFDKAMSYFLASNMISDAKEFHDHAVRAFQNAENNDLANSVDLRFHKSVEARTPNETMQFESLSSSNAGTVWERMARGFVPVELQLEGDMFSPVDDRVNSSTPRPSMDAISGIFQNESFESGDALST
ncbi:hypothetical protein PCA20602_03084 [Pandoraea capi]|uniref:Uncharacterized protein n=2 Tax=Pandoraea capi TaxID=2508286 RepID=A0ABY6W2X2_9BURK|nr:hypothetical protein PCA20602_03084 [Pandoraea capi]